LEPRSQGGLRLVAEKGAESSAAQPQARAESGSRQVGEPEKVVLIT